MEMEGEKGSGSRVVCVTGGGGYIASWLIMRLLQLGYSVRATARLDPKLKKDLSHLTNLPGASQNLKIFNADLNQPDSFIAAIEGCDGVFHVAHPIDLEDCEVDDAKVNMLVEGTLGVLKACVKSKTVKRVVYTSSVATVVANKTGLMEMDESIWSDIDFVKAYKFPGSSYVAAKTLSEQAAIKFAEEHGLELVTVISSMVAGPFICPSLPSSVCMALALIMGKSDQYINLVRANLVHIDDIVAAHIFLLECPKAKGRYICSAIDTTIHELAKYLSIKYPEFEMPMDSLKGIPEMPPIHVSSKKLMDLGFKFKYGLDEIFDGAIQSCKEKGFM